MIENPDLILYRGLFHTLDRSNSAASAVAIKDGRFTAVGREQEELHRQARLSPPRAGKPNGGFSGPCCTSQPPGRKCSK